MMKSYLTSRNSNRLSSSSEIDISQHAINMLSSTATLVLEETYQALIADI